MTCFAHFPPGAGFGMVWPGYNGRNIICHLRKLGHITNNGHIPILVFSRTDLFGRLLDPGYAISLWAGDCAGPLSAHIFYAVTCLA